MFGLPSAVLKAWTEAEYYNGKGGIFFLCHLTGMPSGIVELGVSLQFATIADGHQGGADSKCLGVKEAALMKIKVLV